MNAGTAIVGLVLLLFVGTIIWNMIRDKKNGKSPVCGDCTKCGGGCKH